MERGSPTPLQTVSPERVNQQPMPSFEGHCAATTVSEKIGQFNTLAKQSKQLERKTADAALKRAMVGREEAEAEMRRYRDETRQLRRQVDEGRERERCVGERLESVMETYGRAKETHAHTQVLWEKEIRRARKEAFKAQSAIVKLQEQLKIARAQARTADEALSHEQGRSRAREQEAFQARYALVGCQEELAEAQQRQVLVEQERDAFKSLAQSVADMGRVASEGRVPLPPPDENEEEAIFGPEEMKKDDARNSTGSEGTGGNASPAASLSVPRVRGNKMLQPPAGTTAGTPRGSSSSRRTSRRVSEALFSITSSAASEAEIDELTRLWQWEKQRANRAVDLVEFLEAECSLRACVCTKKRPRTSLLSGPSGSGSGGPVLDLDDGGDRMIRSEKTASAAAVSPTTPARANKLPAAKAIRQSFLRETVSQLPGEEAAMADNQTTSPQQTPPALTSTFFVPDKGVFRTVSQQISEAMEEAAAAPGEVEASDDAAVPVPDEAAVETAADTTETAEMELGVEHTLFRQAFVDEENENNNDADTTVGDVTADTGYTVETTTTTTLDMPADASMYARTPSVEPPSFALLAQQRTSLLSLLDAPHRRDEPEPPVHFHVPTCAAPETLEADASHADVQMEDRYGAANDDDDDDDGDVTPQPEVWEQPEQPKAPRLQPYPLPQPTAGDSSNDGYAEVEDEVLDVDNSHYDDDDDDNRAVEAMLRMQSPVEPVEPIENRFPPRPHTVTGGCYRTATKTTTTKVPLREENTDPNLSRRLLAAQQAQQAQQVRQKRAPHGDAMTPTMTREECLAQIRERRGRARSTTRRSGSGSGSGSGGGRTGSTAPVACVTPRRPVTPGSERRQMSAPMSRSRAASARRVQT